MTLAIERVRRRLEFGAVASVCRAGGASAGYDWLGGIAARFGARLDRREPTDGGDGKDKRSDGIYTYGIAAN